MAAESGVCDGDTVLSTYTSQDAKDEIVAGLKSAAEEIGGFGVLVGENWIINSPDAKDVQSALGGALVADG